MPIVWNNADLPDLAPTVPYEEILDDLARLGYAGCQFGRGFPEGIRLAPELARRNLRMAERYWTLPADADGLIGDPEELLRHGLAHLLSIGGEVLVVALDGGADRDEWAGRVADDGPRWPDAAFDRLAGLLRTVAEDAPEHVTVAFHPHAATWIETPDEVDVLAPRLAGSKARLCLDVGHYTVGGGDPVEAIERHGALIAHVHVKDVDGEVLQRLRDAGDLRVRGVGQGTDLHRAGQRSAGPRGRRAGARRHRLLRLADGRAGLDVAPALRGGRDRRAGPALRAAGDGPMRVAVVGTGTMGGTHARLLASIDGVDEVLVVDADAKRASAVANDVRGSAMTFEAAIQAADAIVVATPPALHAEAVDAAVARGIPVLCEKPLTEDLASSLELTRRVEASGAHVEMGFQRRHEPGFVTARQAVVDGTAGRIQLLRLTAFDPRVQERPWSEWPVMDAAPLFLHSSIHDFDFTRWLTGQEVVELTADGSGRDDPRPADPRGIETAVVTMRLSGGGLAVLEASWLHPTGYDSRVELVADGVHLTMGLSDRTPARHVDWPDAQPSPPWTHYLERYERAYRAELIAFLEACRGERPPASSARDGLEAMRIAVAATRAYSERRPVRIDEIPGIAGAEVA